MKALTAFLVLLLSSGYLFSQQLYLPNEKPAKSQFAYSYLQLDINYLHYPIRNVNTNGISLIGAAIFGERLATGLSLDITDSKQFSFTEPNIPQPNLFEFTQVSFYNEVFFHPDSRIDLSVPVKLGLGHATVSNINDFVFGKTLFSNQGIAAGDYFLVAESGVNVAMHLTRNLDFNMGGSYRLTSGATGIMTDNDFFNYSIHVGLRLRLAGRK